MISSSTKSLCVSILLLAFSGDAATFTVRNNCSYTVWAASIPGGGQRLNGSQTWTIIIPAGTNGIQVWGRTGCSFDASGRGQCLTGDCGGLLQCKTYGQPPKTLAEFALGGSSGLPMDFYDVSLVDGYNLPLTVDAAGGSGGQCASTGCGDELNRKCPEELKAADGGACRTACEVFNSSVFCCSGDHEAPSKCRPTAYTQIFKSACPSAYTYAFDDADSTFTCTGADYVITFCPSVSKSGNHTSNTNDGSESGSESDGSGQEAILPDGSWMAASETGDSSSSSSRTQSPAAVFFTAVVHLAATVITLQLGRRL